jgi:hypothetical protein
VRPFDCLKVLPRYVNRVFGNDFSIAEILSAQIANSCIGACDFAIWESIVVPIPYLKIFTDCSAWKRRASEPTRRCEMDDIGAVFDLASLDREADRRVCVRGGEA